MTQTTSSAIATFHLEQRVRVLPSGLRGRVYRTDHGTIVRIAKTSQKICVRLDATGRVHMFKPEDLLPF